MYNLNSAFHPFFVEGYTTANLPVHILEALRNEILEMTEDQSKAVPYNEDLAGSIEYEFAIIKSASIIEPFLDQMAREFWTYHNRPDLAEKKHKINTNNNPNKPYDIWVNFQRKTEYNPVHTHSGLLSFVTYVQIPYLYEDENKDAKSNTKTKGCFKFLYPKPTHAGHGSSISILTLPADSTWVGKTLLFKSDQPHTVEPFYTSDDYRISVAGNLILA